MELALSCLMSKIFYEISQRLIAKLIGIRHKEMFQNVGQMISNQQGSQMIS